MKLTYGQQLYCIGMMMQELELNRKTPGDTRMYLSLDDEDRAVVIHALKEHRKALLNDRDLTSTQPA